MSDPHPDADLHQCPSLLVPAHLLSHVEESAASMNETSTAAAVYTITCDACGVRMESTGTTEEEAIRAAERVGWGIAKSEKETTLCRSCILYNVRFWTDLGTRTR